MNGFNDTFPINGGGPLRPTASGTGREYNDIAIPRGYSQLCH
jgi:hypothetical protein